MNRIIYLICIVSVLSTPLFAQKSLLLIKNLGDLKYEVPVIEVIENNFIILAEPKDLNLLKSKKVEVEVLDNSIEGKEYYLVHPFYETPDEVIPYSRNILEKYGKVLACFNSLILMEAHVDNLHSMTEYRVALDYLELEPMNFSTYKRTIVDPAKQITHYNPLIEEMLKKVNPDSVSYLMHKLCGFHTRHARSTCSKEEVIPYMKQLYLQYGCDTVLSLDLGNYSDEVVGVRRGKKDPSYKKFVLLGGHTDNTRGGDVNSKHQGANDNATGQVAVMEACRVHQHFEFDYTILYCTHNAEEMGLVGSSAITKLLEKEECQTIGGCFSYDMFGMRESDMSFRVYNKGTGAEEFVNKMKDLKSTYNLKQPVKISLSSSSNIG